MNMQCGSCSKDIAVTPERLRNADHAPCPDCPDGGVDLAHARRHGDDD